MLTSRDKESRLLAINMFKTLINKNKRQVFSNLDLYFNEDKEKESFYDEKLIEKIKRFLDKNDKFSSKSKNLY